MSSIVAPEVSALAINVTITEELRWTDTQRGEEFTRPRSTSCSFRTGASRRRPMVGRQAAATAHTSRSPCLTGPSWRPWPPELPAAPARYEPPTAVSAEDPAAVTRQARRTHQPRRPRDCRRRDLNHAECARSAADEDVRWADHCILQVVAQTVRGPARPKYLEHLSEISPRSR